MQIGRVRLDEDEITTAVEVWEWMQTSWVMGAL